MSLPAVTYPVAIKDGLTFNARPSANAWWNDHYKVQRLFFAFEIDCSVQDACRYAMISSDQYKYFIQAHPHALEIKEKLRIDIIIKAKAKVATEVGASYKNAMKYLQRRLPEEFGRPSKRKKTIAEATKPNVIVFVDFSKEA